MKRHLSYNEEETKIFRETPLNVGVLAKAPELMNKTAVAAIVE